MSVQTNKINTVRSNKADWSSEIVKFMRSDLRKSLWQMVNTIVPYVLLWAGMIFMMQQGVAYGWVLLTAIAAGLFMVRVFIIFHDCCHGSFFKSPRANRIVGYITGILTFTPYDQWRSAHNKHHATAGDLDRRGVGDVWTMTVAEYKQSPPLKRLVYRIFRNPLIMFGIGPLVLFLYYMRVPETGAGKKEFSSVIFTNLALLLIIVAFGLTIGFKTYLLIQAPVLFVGGAVGIWLFYIQHQYEDVYWSRNENWTFTASALQGSSHYKLPRILQWITGNIGLHHIHHLRPKIPNYNLQKCNDSIETLQVEQPLTLRKSLKSIGLNLWDEKQRRLISFRAAK